MVCCIILWYHWRYTPALGLHAVELTLRSSSWRVAFGPAWWATWRSLELNVLLIAITGGVDEQSDGATERRAILSRALSISMGSGWPDRLEDPLVSTSNIGTAEWIYHGLPTASWLALKLAAGITASV